MLIYLLIIIGLPLLYCVMKYNQINKKLSYLPGPSFFQFILDFNKHRSITKLLTFYKKKYGDIYKIYFLGDVVINTPEHVKQTLRSNTRPKESTDNLIAISNTKGLFLKHGDEWKMFRNHLAKIFTNENLKKMADTVKNVTNKYTDVWEEQLKVNKSVTVEITSIFKKMTLDSLGLLVLSYDFESNKDSNKLIDNIIQIINTAMFRITFPLPYWKLSFINLNRRLNACNKVVYDTVVKIIDKKRNEEPTENKKRYDDIIDILQSIPEITDKDIFDEVITFIMAGYETTSISLAFIFYMLCIYPEIQKKLREELHIIEADGNLFSNLNSVKYLDCVIKETLRMYNPVIINLRTTEEEIKFGEYIIPKDTEILIDTVSIHKDENYWKDPYVFDPERFNQSFPENVFMPFGGGRRICIGKSFSMMEMKVITWYLLKNYKFRLIDENVEFIEYIFTKPKELIVEIKKIC